MMARHNIIPDEIFKIYQTLEREKEQSITWHEMTEEELWYNLCQCILSSNVPYELAVSATAHLWRHNYLDVNWINETNEARSIISLELSKPIFLPLKKDGTGRKYRFPNNRAKNIVNSAESISSNNIRFRELFSNLAVPEEVRQYLLHKIDGFGLKQTTHFLRNIGYTNSLAIIDTHIISFLSTITDFVANPYNRITDKTYYQLEAIMQELTKNLNVDLALFDMAIWQHMRS